MESAQQLQMVVAEVQAARQQVASLNAQVRELKELLLPLNNNQKIWLSTDRWEQYSWKSKMRPTSLRFEKH